MVRLKVDERSFTAADIRLDFNSIMVRLKVGTTLRVETDIKFQFHYGTIKRKRKIRKIFADY